MSACVACRRREGREVAGQHRRGRNKSNNVVRILPDHCALIATEEKYFVRDNRPAKRAAELIAFNRVAGQGERIPRVEFAVPYKLEQIAVKIVRPRFRNQANRTGRFHPVLRACSSGLHLKFLECVRKGHGHISVRVRIEVSSAIKRVIQPGGQSAGNGYVSPRKRIAASSAIQRRRRRRRSGKRNQFDDSPSIQRQFQNTGVLDHLADSRVARFYQGCVRLNLHLLADLSHFQNDVDHRAAVDLQHNSRLCV